ncbi:VWA domain-containing protein [Oleiharenicola lentus]|uniref:VWA domain-containing protein n=1 Tax=Oleiharenicola lentus TaxID=2508720 RepID=A0A4Q1C988_9BACT|nr:VWA domain-containing protein [Oleiharenicola lentus]RXK55567.1 VWA domain-containing protein [Oleiharenicola lentus]
MKTFIPHLLFAVALTGATLLSAKQAAQPVRVTVDLDRTVLPANEANRSVVKIGLDCLRPPGREARPPVNLALVIDRSGSMSGDKIDRAREAALELVSRLGPDDIVSLIAYDSGVETLVPAQRVREARELESAIRGLEARGNTALHGGVVRAAAEVRRHLGEGRHVPRIILLSDGQANVDPSSPDELGRLGASLVKEGISVTTIGLGLGFNEDLMTRLAERSDGNTYFVENSDDLPRIFAAELGDVLNVVARRVVIEINFPAGVRPLHFVGRDGSIRGQKAELTLNQLYGGQQKFALVEVEIEASSAGAEREIAQASVRYEDAVNQRPATATAASRVKFSGDAKVVVASANHQVQTDYAANVMALAKDKAVELVDAGRRDEAAKVLRQQAAELQAVGETYSNRAVSSLAATAAPEADRVAREGLSNAERKTYRNDAASTRNQQATKP